MKLVTMLSGLFALSVCLAMVPTEVCAEEEFPSQPVRLISPFPQGGSASNAAMALSKVVQDKKLLNGHPLRVSFMPGGATVVGATHVKEAKPDGYTILIWGTSVLTLKGNGNLNWGYEALEPLAGAGTTSYILVANENLPYRGMQDLLAAAEKAPGTITVGVNFGNPSHILMELIAKQKPNAKFRYVQVQGSGDAYQKLLGGHLDAIVVSPGVLKNFNSKGAIPLCSSSDIRAPAFPEVPTLKEIGIDVNYGYTHWYFAPKGTPRDRLDILTNMLRTAFASDELGEMLDNIDIMPTFHDQQGLMGIIRKTEADLNSIQESLQGTK